MNNYQKTTALVVTLIAIFMAVPVSFASGGVLTHQAEVQKTSAILHGFAPTGEAHTRKAYFEWGETSALGTQTQWKDVSRFFPSTSNVSYSLSRLTPETKYYYRLVVLDPEVGMFYGEIKSFTTPKAEISRLGSVLGFSSNTNQTNITTNNQATADNTSSLAGDKSNSNQNTRNRPGLLASLFGWGDVDGNTDTSTLNNEVVNSQEEEVSTYNSSLSLLPASLLGWTILALLIFLVTALLVYVANLYRRLKELKKKKREERQTVPVNLPVS